MLEQVLSTLRGGDAEALVALRTVWSPTELEALYYPSLHRLDDGGRRGGGAGGLMPIRCRYCQRETAVRVTGR